MEYHEETRELQPDVQETEEYSFMQEIIREEKGSRRIWTQIIKYIGLGLLFGAAACLSFFALEPVLEKHFPEDPKQVTIPDEQEESEDLETTEELEGVSADVAVDTEGGKDGETDAMPEDIPEDVMPELTIDNYRELNRALNAVAYEANKCVVEITGVRADQGWQMQAYDEKNSVAGIVVFDNGQELLIFGKSSVMQEAESLTVTFADGSVYPAELKQKDGILGFAVYSVVREEISESTWGQIQIATLGSSNAAAKGDAVIALGKPFGYYGGVGYGVQASVKDTVQEEDGIYGLLCTDITATKDSSGVLVNIQGEVVGMIDQSISDNDSMNLITAYGISDIKDTIELLSNDYSIPYLGVLGVTVTDALAQTQGMPKGVYVQEVEANSPAMEAGIQSGDIIVKMHRTTISTMDDYQEILMDQLVESEVEVTTKRLGADGYVNMKFTVTIGRKE